MLNEAYRQLTMGYWAAAKVIKFPDLQKAPVEAEAGEVAALAHYYQDNEEKRDWLILTARLPHNVTAWNLLTNLAYEEHSLFHPLVRVDLQNKLDALYILEIL